MSDLCTLNESSETLDRINKEVRVMVSVAMASYNGEKYIKEQIDSKVKFEEVYFQKASPVIAVNCGPGTFGLLTRDADKKVL